MTNMFVENSKVWKYSTMGVTVVSSTTSTQLTMAPTHEGVLRGETARGAEGEPRNKMEAAQSSSNSSSNAPPSRRNSTLHRGALRPLVRDATRCNGAAHANK